MRDKLEMDIDKDKLNHNIDKYQKIIEDFYEQHKNEGALRTAFSMNKPESVNKPVKRVRLLLERMREAQKNGKSGEIQLEEDK